MYGFQDYRARLLDALVRLLPAQDSAPPVESGGLVFTRPPKPELGDLAVGTFPLARSLAMAPPQIALRWAEQVTAALGRCENTLASLTIPVVRAQAAGPFLNLFLDAAGLARVTLSSILERGARYGRTDASTGQSVMVEYSSPNTNKPLHLGHVRNNLLGMAISNVLEAAGDRVIRSNLINDRGIHICKSMLAYRRWGLLGDGRWETPETAGEKGDHFVGRYYVLFDQKLKEERAEFARGRGVDLAAFSRAALETLTSPKERRTREEESQSFEEVFLLSSELMRGAQELLRLWEAGDAETLELWRTMNGWVYEGFRETYARLGCRFDRWYHESETWQLGKAEVQKGLEAGVFYRLEDGSVWARLEDVGLKDKLLLRSDGTSVYITQDLGTAVRKFEDYGMDRSIYVVGSEQDAHFRNLFAILKLLGHPWAERLYHASYGLVTLPRGMGKLKSREGTAVDADDLLAELKAEAVRKIREGGYCETEDAVDATGEAIGQGALKVYILQVSSEKNILFDPEKTISFTGDTGPAVQYSHARIHGILRKALASGAVLDGDLMPLAPTAGQPVPADGRTAGGPAGSDGHARSLEGPPPLPPTGPFLLPDRANPELLTSPEEKEVIRRLAEYPDAVALGARQISPTPVATALLELTKAYARMYHEHEVLRAETEDLRRARLQLALCVAQVLRNGLALLTVAAPERM